MRGLPQGAQPLTDGRSERRGSMRFPIVRDMRYRVTHPGVEPESGLGKTVNVSSGGVLFAAPKLLASGRRIELSISWPVQLDGKCALQLFARGRITRCLGTSVAVKIENHVFRTQSSRVLMSA